jgi:hypothetical protein
LQNNQKPPSIISKAQTDPVFKRISPYIRPFFIPIFALFKYIIVKTQNPFLFNQPISFQTFFRFIKPYNYDQTFTKTSIPQVSPSSFWLMVLLSGYPLSHTTQAQNTTENTQTSNATLRTILVTDDNDEVLENVSLKNSRTGMFATTSSNGIATIDAQIGDKIGIYCMGTFLKEISIKDISERVILSSQNPAVARIKPIRGLFNQSLKSELSTGSSQAIYNKDIQKMPATSILNTLVGRLAGTSTFQFSGQPGSDGISFGLRGQDWL